MASRTGIKHESPQVIVLRNGRPVYAASHWDITGEEVARAAGAAETARRTDEDIEGDQWRDE